MGRKRLSKCRLSRCEICKRKIHYTCRLTVGCKYYFIPICKLCGEDLIKEGSYCKRGDYYINEDILKSYLKKVNRILKWKNWLIED